MQAHTIDAGKTLINDKALNFSGWGTSLAFIFVFLHEKIDLPSTWLERIDIALAMCVIMFVMRFTYSVSALKAKLEMHSDDLDNIVNMGNFKKIIIISFSLILLFGMIFLGFKILYFTEQKHMYSADLISLTLIVLGTELIVLMVKSIGKNHARN